MGWTSSDSWKSVSDVRKSIMGDYASGQMSATLLKMQRGLNRSRNQLWALEERGGVVTITVFLVSKEGGSFAMKSMGIEAHPYYYDCPESFLSKIDPPTNDMGEEWLAGARVFQEARKRTFDVGDKVMVYGKPYTVVGTADKKTQRWYLIEGEEAGIYRAKPEEMTLEGEPEKFGPSVMIVERQSVGV